MSNDLIMEVEESLKQERIEKLWKEYGPYILAGAVLAILITAATTAWTHQREKSFTANTSIMLSAMEEENIPEALKEASHTSLPGHRALMNLTAAGMHMRNDEREEALAAYQAIAKDSEIPATYRDLGQLMAVRVGWDLNPAEETAKTLLPQIVSIANAENSPWKFHARIQSALMKAHGLKDYQAAREDLVTVEHAELVPQALREKAMALYHIYGLEQAALEAEKKSEASQAQKEDAAG